MSNQLNAFLVILITVIFPVNSQAMICFDSISCRDNRGCIFMRDAKTIEGKVLEIKKSDYVLPFLGVEQTTLVMSSTHPIAPIEEVKIVYVLIDEMTVSQFEIGGIYKIPVNMTEKRDHFVYQTPCLTDPPVSKQQ